MTSLSINRRGAFLHVCGGPRKCGTATSVNYVYDVLIKVKGNLADHPDGFIIDNQAVHEYWTTKYPRGYPKPGTSCEVMAVDACTDLRKKVEKRGWTVIEVRVRVSGSNWESTLECLWKER